MGRSVDNLLGFHLAPFWLRIDWLREMSALPELVDTGTDLRAWLDRALSIGPILRTAPTRESVVHRRERRARG